MALDLICSMPIAGVRRTGYEAGGITGEAIRFDAKSMVETRDTILPGNQQGELDNLSLGVAGLERGEELIGNAQRRLGHGLYIT